MTEEPDEQLAVAVQERREAQRLRDRLSRAEQEAERTAKESQRAAATELDERADVDALESMSWSRILSALRGSHASDVEREQAEAQRATYEAGIALARAGAARREVESLREELERLGDVDTAYADALAAKEEWLSQHDLAAGPRLGEIAAEKGDLSALNQELREAHEAGVLALRHLHSAIELLGKARSWSAWDTFGGGGLITDAIKYDRLDSVQRELVEVDAALKRFGHELADVHLPALAALDIGRLTGALDVWFDNIFSDWAVRSRIIDAEEKVVEAAAQVADTVRALEERRTSGADRYDELEAERRGLLGA